MSRLMNVVWLMIAVQTAVTEKDRGRAIQVGYDDGYDMYYGGGQDSVCLDEQTFNQTMIEQTEMTMRNREMFIHAIEYNKKKRNMFLDHFRDFFEQRVSRIEKVMSEFVQQMSSFEQQVPRFEQQMSQFVQQMSQFVQQMSQFEQQMPRFEDRMEYKPTSCFDSLKTKSQVSGLFEIYPGGRHLPLTVYCDMDTDGGGWTVFQRREDGSENFDRDWKDYRFGFGHVEGEFWLGNEYIHALTKSRHGELRIDMEDFEGKRKYAHYKIFRVESKRKGYVIRVARYSGDAGDALRGHRRQAFSTWDQDHDAMDGTSCADNFGGGWWFKDCHDSNLNGHYLAGEHGSPGKGIIWFNFHNRNNYSLKWTEMKLREGNPLT